MTADSGEAAVANGREWGSYNPPGYCLKWVRAECWQVGSLYGSAIDAWYGAMRRHPGDRNPPLGAPMFYAGGKYGHIVLNTEPGRIRSTDCQYAGQVSEANTDWPEDNWGQEYLGWTEDLNGVDLPLGGEDEMQPEDWTKLRQIVAEEVARNNPAATDKVWFEEMEVTQPNGKVVTKSTRQVLRETWQRVAKGL